jgi:hypothetical protein
MSFQFLFLLFLVEMNNLQSFPDNTMDRSKGGCHGGGAATDAAGISVNQNQTTKNQREHSSQQDTTAALLQTDTNCNSTDIVYCE